jgi:hypothetical protein
MEAFEPCWEEPPSLSPEIEGKYEGGGSKGRKDVEKGKKGVEEGRKEVEEGRKEVEEGREEVEKGRR